MASTDPVALQAAIDNLCEDMEDFAALVNNAANVDSGNVTTRLGTVTKNFAKVMEELAASGVITSVSEEGNQVLAAPTNINFVGANVTASDDGDGTVTVTLTTSGGSSISISEEGSQVATGVTDIDFVGAEVTASDDGDNTVTVTMTSPGGSSISVSEEGTDIVTGVTNFNFVGAAVTASDDGDGTVTITVSSAGGAPAYTSGLNVVDSRMVVIDNGILYTPNPASLPIASTPATMNMDDWRPLIGITQATEVLFTACTGQSNAVGNSNVDGSAVAVPHRGRDDLQVFNSDLTTWGSSNYNLSPWTLTAPHGNAGQCNIGLSFACRMHDEYGGQAYHTHYATGGKSIQEWIRTDAAPEMWDGFKAKMDAAYATTEVDSTPLKALVWVQSEEDAFHVWPAGGYNNFPFDSVTTEDNNNDIYTAYYESLGLLRDKLLGEAWFSDDTVLILVGPSSHPGSNHEDSMPAKAQHDFASHNRNVMFVHTADMPTYDATHYRGDALDQLGYEWCWGAYQNRNNPPALQTAWIDRAGRHYRRGIDSDEYGSPDTSRASVLPPAPLYRFQTTSLVEIISGGVAQLDSSYMRLRAEGTPAADTLDRIEGGEDGMLLIIRADQAGDTLTITHGTASAGNNIVLSGLVDLDFSSMGRHGTLTLVFDGTLNLWIETARNIPSASTGGGSTDPLITPRGAAELAITDSTPNANTYRTISVSSSFHAIDSASADNVGRILIDGAAPTSAHTGYRLILRPENSNNPITLQHEEFSDASALGEINLSNNNDMILATRESSIELVYDHGLTRWVEVGRNEPVAAAPTLIANIRGSATIASGAVTATHTFMFVDTEASASTDDLDTINGGNDGERLTIRATSGGRDVVVKHLTGNIYLAGAADMTLDNNNQVIELIYDSSTSRWLETNRTEPAVVLPSVITTEKLITPRGSTLTIASGVITVTDSFHAINPQADTDPADDLTDIIGGTEGQYLVLRPAGGADVLSILNNAGANSAQDVWTSSGATVVLSGTREVIVLFCIGSAGWVQIGGVA